MMGYDRILRIPFTASVRLRALLLKAGPGRQTPSKVSLVGPQLPFEYIYWLLHDQFANADSLDFDNVFDKASTQEFNIPQSRDVGEYAVKWVVSFPPEKFSSWRNESCKILKSVEHYPFHPSIAGCGKHTNLLRWIPWKLDGGESIFSLSHFQEVLITFCSIKVSQ